MLDLLPANRRRKLGDGLVLSEFAGEGSKGPYNIKGISFLSILLMTSLFKSLQRKSCLEYVIHVFEPFM